MKALNGFLMTQIQTTFKDVRGYVMLENIIGRIIICRML